MSYSSDTSNKYRLGFNGMEKKNESFSDAYDFGARIYDGRLGRWLALDPLMMKYPSMSPYNGMGNNPIFFVDINGRDIIPKTGWVGSAYEQIFNQLLSMNCPEFMIIYNHYNDKSNDLYLFFSQYQHRLISGKVEESNKFEINDDGSLTQGGGTVKLSPTSSIVSMNTNDIVSRVTGKKINDNPLTRNENGYKITYNLYEVTVSKLNTFGRAFFLYHELLHAYIYNDPSTSNTVNNGFTQHSIMASDKYRNMMINLLTSSNKNLSLGISPEQIKDLSYLGLRETNEYRNFIPKKARIKENLWDDTELTHKLKAEYLKKYNEAQDKYLSDMDELMSDTNIVIETEIIKTEKE